MSHAVVGGGATGLVAAIELARRGREVTLFESSVRFGGRAQSLEEDGFVMNLGPHALYAFAERRLQALGVSVTGGAPQTGLTMQLGDRLAELPVGARSLLGSGGLGWWDKARFAALLSRLAWFDAERLDTVCVSGWLDELRMRGAVRRLVLATLRISTYINAPDRMSAGAAVRQLRAALDGVRYLDGGWGTMVRGLEARADALGVVRRSGARVEALEVHGASRRGPHGRASAIRLRGGESVSTDGVVLTLSPKACARLLGVAAPSTLIDFASSVVAVRAACLDVALWRLPRRHPVLILGTDEPTYLSIHSNVAKLAPVGGGLIHAARYLAPGEKATSSTRAQLERGLDLCQPGWRDETLRARWSPAMTVMHAIPDARVGGLRGRPKAGDTGLANVALAGDWVGPERLLFDACLVSAEAAAEQLSPDRDRAGRAGEAPLRRAR